MDYHEFCQLKQLARKFLSEVMPDFAIPSAPPTTDRPALDQPDALLTEKQVSREYGLKAGWLQQRRYHGGGPPYVRLGRSIRYRRSDLEEWIAAQAASSTSEYA